MPIERPTFHESWYRVENLKPRLRSTVQVSRQHFRGQQWHVIQDHSNNMFFRLAEPAYRFIGLLDGKRTVNEAWKTANEGLGDDAPTQGEVIQLLGQLYTGNLLQADVPADALTLFSRFKKRRQREVTSYLMNIMFARLPIFDPDRFLNKWLPVLGWIFSPIGFVVWAILLGFGIFSISQYPSWSTELANQRNGLLAPQNLILLYIAFAMIKACHEMGHAISCKKFGKQEGAGGEVHIIGIMFLVFTPVPYVDASSSWALPNKWHRAIVGAAGMWVELAIASVAAMVWSHTSSEYWLHAFAYNIMFVAGFSTIVFNANPLLRYDGYYILSDILEIPNLAQRGKDYVYYLVKKYAWNVRNARNPAYSSSEKAWLFVYAIASFLMRIVVTFSIMFYLSGVLNGALIIVAAGMTIAGLVTWVCVPAGKYLHYLWTSGELQRVRGRAMITSFLFFGGLIAAIGFLPLPDRSRAQGVIEPQADESQTYARELYVNEDAPVSWMDIAGRPTRDSIAQRLGMPVVKAGDPILTQEKLDLQKDIEQAQAQVDAARIHLNQMISNQPDQQEIAEAQYKAAQDSLDKKRDLLDRLKVSAPINGILIAQPLEDHEFAYLKRSDHLGMVADLHHLIVRAAAKNELEGLLRSEAKDTSIEIRVLGRPDILLTGTIYQMPEAGANRLPHPSLGYQLGGELNTSPDDRQGTETTENFFEVRINDLKVVTGPDDVVKRFKATGDITLLPGQRVVVRFDFKPKPLAVQAWTTLRQVFQKKFQL